MRRGAAAGRLKAEIQSAQVRRHVRRDGVVGDLGVGDGGVAVVRAGPYVDAHGAVTSLAGAVPGGYGLARFDSAGNADLTFGNAGAVSLPAGGTNLALQADGKAITASQPNVQPYVFGVARVNTDGTPDSSFGIGGVASGNTQSGAMGDGAIAVQSTGKIIVAGTAT